MAVVVAALAPTAAMASAPDIAAYMTARAAAADGSVVAASAAYDRALRATPDNADVALRAFRQALSAGDGALAARAMEPLRRAGRLPGDATLIPLSQAAARGDRAGAAAAAATLAKSPLALLAPSLDGWITFANGGDPFPALDRAAAGKDPLAARLAGETRAMLLIAKGDLDRGLPAVKAIVAPIDLRIAASQLLAADGRRDEARSLLTGDDPVIAALREGVPAKPTLAFGVSRLLARVAGDLTQSEGASTLTIALTRAALTADPGYDRARLLLAAALNRERATDLALATLDQVDQRGPYAQSAQTARIVVLAAADRDAEALAAAKTRAEGRDAGRDDWQRYGDRLATAERYAEAAAWYGRALDADGTAAEWPVWLQYGGALDRAGKWREAKPALEKAVALAPNEPIALNYLGYARAEHGDDVPAATRMLEKASQLAPTNDSITDSLGWVYHLSGDTSRALPLIERAAAGEPDNSEISEHLGDIYWTVGRRYEARYAWRAAAITADASDADRLRAKLSDGLPQRR